MALSTYRASTSAAVLLLAALVGCTAEEAPVEPPKFSHAPEGAKPVDPYEHSTSRFGAVPLHAGFSPDPRVVGGTAVGEVMAQLIHRKCKGWISEIPDYLLDADTAFFQLHVLGR